MEADEAFDFFIQLEKMMSECYTEIYKICRDKSISSELEELSKEEIDHTNLLKWGKDYLDRAQNASGCNFERPAELRLVQEKIDQLINDIQGKKTGLLEAINDITVLERIMQQLYLRRIAEVKSSSLKRIFDTLSLSSREHIKSLFRIRQSLNSSNLSASSITDSARSNVLKNFSNDTFFGKKKVNPKCVPVHTAKEASSSKGSH